MEYYRRKICETFSSVRNDSSQLLGRDLKKMFWIDDCVTDDKSIHDVPEQTDGSGVAAGGVDSVCCDNYDCISVSLNLRGTIIDWSPQKGKLNKVRPP